MQKTVEARHELIVTDLTSAEVWVYFFALKFIDIFSFFKITRAFED